MHKAATMNQSDRRHGKRVAADLLCSLITPSGAKYPAMARNLSVGGAFVECEQRQLQPGDRLALSFNLPSGGRLHRVEAESEVIHGPARVSMTAYGFGLAFLEVPPEQLQRIEAFIDARPAL